MESKKSESKKLTVAGIGSGKFSQITGQVLEALKNCDCIVGYEVYINLVRGYFPDKEYLSTPMRKEEERCRLALEQADSGKNVVFICSGDAGVYGMAGLIYELARDFPKVQISVLPGITAALSGASILGAPLVHDFAIISLSDLMTPWEKIEKRLECASLSDFCIVLYNPMSHKRKDYLFKACQILLKNLSPATPCGYVKNIGREGEESKILSLGDLQNAELDMFTTVFIGNSTTRIIDSPRGKKLVTPRGYKVEKESGSNENKKSIFVFAGTTEGRELCEKLSESGFDCTVSVATEYGEKLLPKKENLTVLQGRMKSEDMIKAFSQKKYACVVDATHPFATEVSKEIKKACNYTQIRRIRLARNTESSDDFSIDSNRKGEIHFPDISSAADWLESQSGKIFVSTGSKELPKLCEKITDKSRLIVRVLPSIESLKICSDCKIPQSQIIAMQGPFSGETNELQFEENGAKILLTKESGVRGGYFEKIQAAKKLGMKIAVIENPEKAGRASGKDAREKTASETQIFHSVGEICAIIKQSQ